jgi:hypothetical protein
MRLPDLSASDEFLAAIQKLQSVAVMTMYFFMLCVFKCLCSLSDAAPRLIYLCFAFRLCNLAHSPALCADLLGLDNTAMITFEILSEVICFFMCCVFCVVRFKDNELYHISIIS